MLNLILILSLIITGIHVSMWEGMIFGKVAEWIHSKIGPVASKPVYSCLSCMSSLWTILLWGCFYDTYLTLLLPLTILGVSGLNTIISKILNNE
jgi:hypothetical protein